MYFNRRNEIVKINGVKMGDDLDFRGPFALDNAHNQVFEGLKAANRLNAVTLAGLKDHAKYFAWVLPGVSSVWLWRMLSRCFWINPIMLLHKSDNLLNQIGRI